MTDYTNPFNGQHSETGFTGRTATSFRAEMAQRGRNESALVAVGSKPATYSRSDMPTSREFLAQQHQKEARAETSQWHHHETGTAMFVNGISAEQAPHNWLSAHGFHAVNSQGEPVHPSAAQARMLVSAYLNAQARGGQESVSATDNGLPASVATVHLRQGVIKAG